MSCDEEFAGHTPSTNVCQSNLLASTQAKEQISWLTEESAAALEIGKYYTVLLQAVVAT
jgi:hypothetical protein